jgi:hypothetical protein
MLAIGDSRLSPQTELFNPPTLFGYDHMWCGGIAMLPDWAPSITLPMRHGKNYNNLICDGHVIAVDRVKWHNPTNSALFWNNDHQPHPEFWY